MTTRNSFDIDGVIFMGPGRTGVFPGPNDIIVTGRSFEESTETLEMLAARGIHNAVFFNPLPFVHKTRVSSGEHKAKIISKFKPVIHFEDDPIQAKIISDCCPETKVVLLVHDLVEKENVRHEQW